MQRRFDVEFRLGCEACEVLTKNGRVTAVMLRDGPLHTGAIVICLGASSATFLRTLDVRLPIIPVRGYSVTLPEGRAAPRVSISDTEHRIVFSSMNGFVRIAGFADFVGFDVSADEARIGKLLRVAQSIAPDAADYSAASRQPWGGFRPMTADSQPIVACTKTPGLYLNCGHGMLGWTLACATGFNIAEQIATQA
jgi:D-amino-acid dehydrogenase